LQYAAFQVKSIQGGNHFGHIITRPKFHEPETTGTAGFCITDHACRGDLKTVAHEKLIEALIRRVKREVSYVELRHGSSPFGAPLIFLECRGKNGRARDANPPQVGLKSGDVCGLETLGTTSDFKFNRLAFVQRFVSISLNGGEMYEYIFAGLALDESKALAGVKPLYGSLFFHGSSFAVDLAIWCFSSNSVEPPAATKKAARCANSQPL
jgi:hypothetical protein